MTTAASAGRLIRSWHPVAGVFALVHVVFLLGVLLVRSDAEIATASPLRSGPDAFGVLWFFALPLLLEVLVVGVPLIQVVNRLWQQPTNYLAYLGSIALFALYFFFAAALYGTEPAAYKTGLLGVFVALLIGWGFLVGETDEE